MSGEKIEIQACDGMAPAWVFKPQAKGEAGPWPGVIFYMDAGGVRPALQTMAQRVADHGFVVLLPDLFYRAGENTPLTVDQFLTDDGVRAAQMAKMQALSQTRLRQDTQAYLDRLVGLPDVSDRVGAVGYCMGGGCALTAAGAYPEQVKAAASFHGGRLATDAEDSPHRLAGQMKARIYVGVAAIDDHFDGAEEGRLAHALYDAGVDHTIETYAGARHGFAVIDMPVYDHTASERHVARTLALFNETLR